MPWRKILPYALVALLAFLAGAVPQLYLAIHDTPAAPVEDDGTPEPYRIQEDLLVRARPNGTRDDLEISFRGSPDARARLTIEDPSREPRHILAEWNATANEVRVFDAQHLSRLFVVRADTTGSEPATLLQWVWVGRAHLLTASSPEGLAAQLQEASP